MANLLIKGGTIITADAKHPRAEAVLCQDNLISAVGTVNEITQLKGNAETTILDLKGRTLIPGFNDSHIHVNSTGEFEQQLNLLGMSKAEILESLAELDAQLPKGEALMGGQWDYPNCPTPHRKDIDSIIPDRPVFLMQFSGHGAWVNTAFIKKMKYSADTPDWEPGGLEKDDAGELTGIIREPGSAPGMRKVYMKRIRDKGLTRENIAKAHATLLRHGITTAQDNTWFPGHLDVIRSLHNAGGPHARLSCWSLGVFPPLDFLFGLKRFDERWFHRGPRKYFADGAFSSHTALLCEPYSDQPETSGGGITEDKAIKPLIRAARNRRQIACHSIGDEATRRYVSAVEAVTRKYPHTRTLRHRIEHGQLIRPEDFQRIAESGMVVAAQPHAAGNHKKDIGLLGPERASRAYPFRALLDAGVPLAFGSDFPGEITFDPIYGIHLAVNMENDGAISAEEALVAYTAGSAYAEFREEEKGSIEIGKLADFAVLSSDPTKVSSRKIKDIFVESTIIDGKIVYVREEPSAMTQGTADYC